MAYDQSPPDNTFTVVQEFCSDLAEHFGNRLACDAGILLHLRVGISQIFVCILQIGKIYVDNPLEEPENMHGVVCVGIVYQRQPQAAIRGECEGPDDLGDKMGRRHKPDGMDPSILQFKHHCREPFDRDFMCAFAGVILADLVVLTVDTAKGAVAEKDVADSPRSSEPGLFTEVWRVRGHDRQRTGITAGDFVSESIVAAVVRTDAAGLQQRLKSPGTPQRARRNGEG